MARMTRFRLAALSIGLLTLLQATAPQAETGDAAKRLPLRMGRLPRHAWRSWSATATIARVRCRRLPTTPVSSRNRSPRRGSR